LSELPAKAAIVERLLDAINRRDLDDLTACCTPEVEFHSALAATEGRSYSGHAGLAQYLEDRKQAWSSFRIDIDDVLDAGDGVVLLMRVVATGRGSGIPVEQEMGGVLEFDGDRLRRYSSHLDRDDARRAGGLA
jgi:ketosteroid isomerase-like protein